MSDDLRTVFVVTRPGGRARRYGPSAVARTAVGLIVLGLLAGCASSGPPAVLPPFEDPELRLPARPDSLRFAVIGDSGTGDRQQYELANMLTSYASVFPLDLVLMVGDNLYGSEDPDDYEEKFEAPYAELLDSGVEFYASLGNHDEPAQRHYEHFNMDGELYYSFSPAGHDVRFFALYTDYLDPEQLEWLEDELASSDERWKICFFHHPIYSSGGRHGPDLELREALEPIFEEHGVDVVFSGHEHFYERLRPQGGISYFISGAAAKLRDGDIEETGRTLAGYDEDRSFLLVEIDGQELHFQAVSRTGLTVDSGVIVNEESAVGDGGGWAPRPEEAAGSSASAGGSGASAGGTSASAGGKSASAGGSSVSGGGPPPARPGSR